MIRVFKPSSRATPLTMLSEDVIRVNHNNGRQTSVLLDTNILITIESAYRTGQRHQQLKKSGILDMLKLISRNTKYDVFISPAAAYQELPPSRRRAVEEAFKKFTKNYLPTFIEDPSSQKITLNDHSEDTENFNSLNRERQELISCSYASLLALNLISRIEDLSEIDRFQLYVDYCAECLDILSLKELAIARYVLAPERGLTETLRKQKVAATRNFLRLKRGAGKGLKPSDVLKRIALNGANDLKLISAADIVNIAEERLGYRLFRLDVWIATSDEKLYEFCCACPGLISSGNRAMLARFINTHDDILGTSYWQESTSILTHILNGRSDKISREKDLSLVVGAALEIEAYLDSDKAAEHLILRRWR